MRTCTDVLRNQILVIFWHIHKQALFLAHAIIKSQKTRKGAWYGKNLNLENEEMEIGNEEMEIGEFGEMRKRQMIRELWTQAPSFPGLPL